MPGRSLVIISGSSGELEWILPILVRRHEASNENFEIWFLKKSAFMSYQSNSTLVRIVGQLSFLKLHEEFIFTVYKWSELSIVTRKLLFHCPRLAPFFGIRLNEEIKFSGSFKNLYIEFTSLIRFDERFIRQKFIYNRSVYFPHSHYPYAYSVRCTKNHRLKGLSKSTLLVGSDEDYQVLSNNYKLNHLNVLTIGHPKFNWNYVSSYHSNYTSCRKNDKLKVLVLSRGESSYWSESDRNFAFLDIKFALDKVFGDSYELSVKLHPREHTIPYIGGETKLVVRNLSVFDSQDIDLFITLWSSSAIDVRFVGKNVVEYWNSNLHSIQQIEIDENTYKTKFELLRIVTNCKNKSELLHVLTNLKTEKFANPESPFLKSYFDLSQEIYTSFEKIEHYF